MNQFLLTMLCVLTFSLTVTAQITIRRADFAVTSSPTTLDSSRYKALTRTGAVVPTFGNNQTWDYTGLKDSSTNVYTDYYIPTAAFGTTPTAFGTATIAHNYNSVFQVFQYPSRSYERIDSEGYVELGSITNGAKFSISATSGGTADTLYFPAGIYAYTPPHPFVKFPITANSSWNVTSRVPVDFQLSVAAFGLNKTPGQKVTTIISRDTVVGWGTLKLKNPAGGAASSFAVLLERKDETYIDSFFVGGAPAPAQLLGAFGLVQGSRTVYSTQYSFRGIGFSEPAMQMYVNSSGAITYISRAVNVALGLTTDSREVTDVAIATKVYPNPAHTEGVNFEFNKTTDAQWNVMVYNATGQIISINPIKGQIGTTTQHVALDRNLPVGTYFYNLLDEHSRIRANGQFLFMN